MPKRIIWLTDIHLDFLDSPSVELFLDRVVAEKPDAVLITGDVSTARRLVSDLELMAVRLLCPIYFVLGNHDYYHGSIEGVRSEIGQGFHADNLHYLSEDGVVQIDDHVALVGHDGWADGRNGDLANTRLDLNDFYLIADFLGLDRWGRYRLMERLADEAATHFEQVLPEAAANNRHVIVATHVPPFWEAAFYQGRPSPADALPFLSNWSVGDVLMRVAANNPTCNLTVLCGHTHEFGIYSAEPNLEVRVGGAQYGKPDVAELLALGRRVLPRRSNHHRTA